MIFYLSDDADSDYQQFYSFCEEKYKYEEPDEPDFQKIAAEARLTRMRKSKVWLIFCYSTFADRISTKIRVLARLLPHNTCMWWCRSIRFPCNGALYWFGA